MQAIDMETKYITGSQKDLAYNTPPRMRRSLFYCGDNGGWNVSWIPCYLNPSPSVVILLMRYCLEPKWAIWVYLSIMMWILGAAGNDESINKLWMSCSLLGLNRLSNVWKAVHVLTLKRVRLSISVRKYQNVVLGFEILLFKPTFTYCH